MDSFGLIFCFYGGWPESHKSLEGLGGDTRTLVRHLKEKNIDHSKKLLVGL